MGNNSQGFFRLSNLTLKFIDSLFGNVLLTLTQSNFQPMSNFKDFFRKHDPYGIDLQVDSLFIITLTRIHLKNGLVNKHFDQFYLRLNFQADEDYLLGWLT